MDNKYMVTLLFLLSIVLFIISLAGGYLDYKNVMTLAQAVFGEFKGISEKFDITTQIKIMIIIFLRNLSVTSLMVVTGPFLGLLSYLVISFNGYLIGGVFRYSLLERGLIKSLMLLIPHGIVEIPTFFYAAYLGIKLGISYMRRKNDKIDHLEFIEYYRKSLNKIITRITPLLLIAAFIESFITPYIASLV